MVGFHGETSILFYVWQMIKRAIRGVLLLCFQNISGMRAFGKQLCRTHL